MYLSWLESGAYTSDVVGSIPTIGTKKHQINGALTMVLEYRR